MLSQHGRVSGKPAAGARERRTRERLPFARQSQLYSCQTRIRGHSSRRYCAARTAFRRCQSTAAIHAFEAENNPIVATQYHRRIDGLTSFDSLGYDHCSTPLVAGRLATSGQLRLVTLWRRQMPQTRFHELVRSDVSLPALIVYRGTAGGIASMFRPGKSRCRKGTGHAGEDLLKSRRGRSALS